MTGAVASTAEARERLCARWPGRREQINQLLGLLGEPHDHALPVFVHGPPVTGKSSIVRDVFTTLGRPFAYTSLVDSHTPRLLLDAILEELQPHLEGLTEKQMRCDRLADLVSLLAKGLPADGPAVYLVIDEATRLLDWKGTDHLLPALMKLSELTGAPPRPAPRARDRASRAASATRAFESITNPTRRRDAVGRLPFPPLPLPALDSPAPIRRLPPTGRNVGTILVATPGWDAFRSAAGVRPPVPVFFDSYTKAQLQAILLSERPVDADEKLYTNFVASVLPLYTATCKSLHELRALLGPLWRRYVAPWEAARDAEDATAAERPAAISVSESEKENDAEKDEDAGPRLPEPRHLFAMLQSGNAAPSFARGGAAGTSGAGVGARRPREGPVLHAGLAVPLSAASLALARGDWPVPEDAGAGAGKLDFDIPRLTKFMLLSAHLATMNKESVDRRLFGHMVEGRKAGTAAAGPSSKRRRGAMGADRQQEAAATAAMEGPGTFNLERLLAYFRIVTKQAYDEDDAASEELARELLSADVFMQISSMVALGLLTRTSGSDALDGVRFRCDIGNDMARKIAANLRVNLDNYLFYT